MLQFKPEFVINEGYNADTAFNRTNFEFTLEQFVSITTGNAYHTIAWGAVPVGVVVGGLTGGILTFELGEWGAYPGAIIGGTGAYAGVYYGLSIPTNITTTYVAEQLGQIYYPLPTTSPYDISTSFYQNYDGTVDVNTSITISKGLMGTSNLATLLISFQQDGITLGNITIQTDFTNPENIAWIADSLKSYATLKTEVDSPIGKYILGTNGSESLTGSGTLTPRKKHHFKMHVNSKVAKSYSYAA